MEKHVDDNIVNWEYTDLGDYILLDRFKGSCLDIIVPNHINSKPVRLKAIDNLVIPNIKKIKSFTVLPHSDGSKVMLETTELIYAFRENCVLETINLSGLDTSKVVNMHGMFFGCQNIHTINLCGVDTTKVRDMRHIFAACPNLRFLDISSFKTISLEYADNMFSFNYSLRFVKMDNFFTKKLDISKIFSGFFELYQLPLLLITNDTRIIDHKGIPGYPFNRVPLSTKFLDNNFGTSINKVFYTVFESDELKLLDSIHENAY